MHKIYNLTFSFFLILIITLHSFSPLLVFASDSDKPDNIYDSDKWNTYDNSDITNVIVDQLLNRGIHEGDADFYENFIRYATEYISYGLSQVGAIFNKDLYEVDDNKERLYEDLRNITNNGKISVDKTSNALKISKSFTDSALIYLKNKTKEPENGGYELIPTIPLRKVSTMYFYTPQQFKTLVNLINDNDGMIGLFIEGSLAYFYKLDSGALWIKHTKNNISNGDETKTFYPVYSIRNVNSGNITYPGYYAKSYNETALNWEDDANLDFSASKRTSNFFMLDTFEFMRGSSSETYSTKPFSYHRYVVTKSGASLPVFNTLNDAIAYTVDHNLYYTSSSYTGEGKEIIIPFDEIDKILKGYYDGMYDLLQQLIEQNGGNALTPEQLQKLVDEVQASFGMLKDTINQGFEQQDILIQKNSGILQNIADALNAFFMQTKEYRNRLIDMLDKFAQGEEDRDEEQQKLLEKFFSGIGGGTGGGMKYIKIQSASNSSLDANQREFIIDTDIENPYYESCLSWYPLNGVADVQYTNGNTVILTFFNYNKRYNVYCKYNDAGQNIRCTSNTVSVSVGPPDTVIEDGSQWDSFVSGLNEDLTDLKNSITDLHDGMNAKFDSVFYNALNQNWLELIYESINIHIENFEDFALDCIGYLKDIRNGTGGDRQLPSLPSPGGSGNGWDFMDFLTDIAKDIAQNSLDEGAQKVGDLISEVLGGLGECFDVLSEVFPFSVPWDIALLMGALARDPQTPKFELPLVFEKYGINEKIVIDLSAFEPVSRISRAFLTLIWAMYLMNFTVRFTDTKNL